MELFVSAISTVMRSDANKTCLHHSKLYFAALASSYMLRNSRRSSVDPTCIEHFHANLSCGYVPIGSNASSRPCTSDSWAVE